MKLLIIVFCLLSERYLTHRAAALRFNWFAAYFTRMKQVITSINNPWLLLLLIVLPPVLLCWLVLHSLGFILFGFVSLVINFVVFYICIGTENVFYPMIEPGINDENTLSSAYLARVNKNIFAIIFWFLFLGAPAILAYRLLTLCEKEAETQEAAKRIVDILDWPTARLTAMLYLLVGNFQAGFEYYRRLFFSTPANNTHLLSETGLLAAYTKDSETVSLPNAQHLVEHALIVFLVFIALFTLISWL